MTRKWILKGAGLLWFVFGPRAGADYLRAAPQDQQQKSAYTLDEYNTFKAADAEQNPQEKIKQLDDFVKQYPSSTLLPYIYRDYYQTDFALKNFAGSMEYADRIAALGDNVDIQMRLEALAARAQAYTNGGMNDKTLPADIVMQTKARDAAALGLKMLHDWKKPDAMIKDQYAQQVKSFKILFNSVYMAASKAAEVSLAMGEAEVSRMGQAMEENQAIAKKTREEQAEFEQRKKEAVDLGLKPGTSEYVEYVATGRITSVAVQASGQATVHFTSAPSGAEIYVDGKFVGNTPSDIMIPAGEHLVRVTAGGREWSRSVQITGGEITLHAEVGASATPENPAQR